MPNNYDDIQNKKELDDRREAMAEDLRHQQEQRAENNGTANGLLIGGITTALLGLGAAAAYYYLNPNPSTIINVPASPAASVSAPPPQVRIIEVEKPVIVPATVAPAPKVVEVPKPVLVPGATKIIEVPVPATPGVTGSSPAPAATPSASTSSESTTSPASSSLDTDRN